MQSGLFGAVLMRSPALVADCVRAMRDAVDVEVTVKCRIGVDDQDPEDVLPEFLARIVAAGCERVIIHARKAWLQGLSPKENRDIPPLDYDLVFRMKQLFPDLHISINGGVETLDAAVALLERRSRRRDDRARGLSPALGRARRGGCADLRAPATPGGPRKSRAPCSPISRRILRRGGRLHQVTRHMLGLFAGRPGARLWRRMLSEGATRDGAGPELVETALARMQAQAA